MHEVTLDEMLTALSDGAAWGSAEPVEVRQTHISAVFLVGDRAFKLKKPVSLGFVDYGTAARRRHFCEEEVRLNARLARSIYIGVRPIVRHDEAFRVGAPHEAENVVDWVVEMVRLDDHDQLLAALHAGALDAGLMADLGELIAGFHASAAAVAPGGHGSYATVARNALDNFDQSTAQVGVTVDARVFEAARDATQRALVDLRARIEGRDGAGLTRDTHGDLRLEHVYHHDDELIVVDCIEFNDAFRFADPVADVAFLVMDLRIRWANELADAFCEAYFAASPGGRELLDFYVAYRSAVRAKVHGIAATEPELDQAMRERAHAKSRAHWLFAWSTLAEPTNRPGLVLCAGLPGTGKSSLARALAEHHGFEVVDADVVRKELAGVTAETDMRSAIDGGIYTAEFSNRTYAECLRRACEVVESGGRVAVASTFREDDLRAQFLEAAHARGVAGAMLECTLPDQEALRRIAARVGDASDADASVYEHVAAAWEAPGRFVAGRRFEVSTATRSSAIADAEAALRSVGLH